MIFVVQWLKENKENSKLLMLLKVWENQLQFFFFLQCQILLAIIQMLRTCSYITNLPSHDLIMEIVQN
jgi:hypothetical protein